MKNLDILIQNIRIRKAAREIPDNAIVLDIGCSQGELFQSIEKKLMYGIGFDPNLEQEINCNTYKLFPNKFPSEKSKEILRNKTFGVITLLAVIEHIPVNQLDEFVSEFHKYLNSDGIVIITVPAPLVDHILSVLKKIRLIDGMELEEHHGFDVKTLPEIMQKNGFILRKKKYFEISLNTLFVFESSTFY